ncbi:HpcH/HpaI aldolase/citrate lyase family protein [Paraburkholderia sp. LEh10]|uniref:HpcH/HpaI aldolase family protein n=1 Tax=Paraburkholderia sp. LEh10 TaxID=2821353 RepID=UPI001AE159FE|nr:HpcH/HpaI aldolase/citrate lyase family protein [Paraburkholderia sp. LEh10]MBP0590086.1 HpcH/HpaI aldolase/citrate lyase family protein [Paraburkholderia sp. LEh10]
MKLPENPFKRALQAGRQQIGLWSSLASHVSVEILAGAGFDWLLLDMEHAPNELPMVHSQLQACAGTSAHPIVRPPWNDMVTIKRLLDSGAQTLLIPYVETEDEARNAVAFTRYPPEGVRGYASAARASGFGRVKDYPKLCANELCVLVQIESRLGLQNLERIAAVEGIDGIFIGPGDLSAALGHVGDIKHPDVQAAVEDAIKRIVALGKPAGILIGDEALARRYIELGCTFTAVGSDIGLLARNAEQLAAKFKAAG